MTFWIISSALALVVSALLALALLRRHTTEEPAAAYDMRVYRDQLREVERDLARGVIGAADADRVRTEVSRRILAADAKLRATGSGAGASRGLTLAAAAALGLVVIGGSLAIYRVLGAPGYGDLALSRRIELAAEMRAARPSQAEAENSLPPMPDMAQKPAADYLALLEKLRDTVADRPDDLQGQQLLARNEAVVGNFAASYAAQRKVIELKGAAASAGDHAELADKLILAAGGYVSPEAEAALSRALKRDPSNGIARYYWGLMEAQTGRPDLAFRRWAILLNDSPPDAPWVPPIRAQIADMALRAGVDYALPAPTGGRGPSAADIDAASRMSATDRADMIGSMVDGLSDRLATEGGPPEEWARLIGALGVLGEADRARAIHDEASRVFAGRPDALDLIAAAARQAGLEP
ncbi:c-type cytochrome biogenesis protein CcmI [Pukyongiella litopenaei]|uniref:C-type cytochrome biogenesis protein CcmI n=1 Tax=Pukyongiella litopenaei TaxID=2605946 RepID=A0A2S0MKI8_9RHOB|nr:c-type cytochrome biogenesis protein CcmI [Pukyongiella litopenaei]AVO36390.1 c-type cytochrome biogenesis protein CcmI [Pukyongiella litopenaei]